MAKIRYSIEIEVETSSGISEDTLVAIGRAMRDGIEMNLGDSEDAEFIRMTARPDVTYDCLSGANAERPGAAAKKEEDDSISSAIDRLGY